MSSNTCSKPAIIVVALFLNPYQGSEPGKGWWWSCALSKHFKLHIITQKESEEVCRNLPIVVSDQWTFHPIHKKVTSWKFPAGYLQYQACLKEVVDICPQIIQQYGIQGLCHITLGSFRFLPRYDLLGIPYTVGPLGGGECAPFQINLERPTPILDKITEGVRPIINNSFALLSHLRACMKSARLVLGTSAETVAVVERMGAVKTAVVFPDAYDSPVDVETIKSIRCLQVESVRKEIRLLWQGRSFWWKGPDLALMILRKALDESLGVSLTMVSTWENAFGKGVRKLADKWNLHSHLRFVESMSREAFLEMAQDHHGMLTTSLHDSGGIPLLEAQALGLPCITLGLGGHKLAACPDAGVSIDSPHIEKFIEKAVDCLRGWQQTPEKWLDESYRGAIFSSQFTINKLANDVAELIVPALK